MSINWIPNPAVMEEDEREWSERRRKEIVADMLACGFPHMVWIVHTSNINPYKSRPGMMDWIELHKCQVSYMGFTPEMCVGFLDIKDAVMFKLTWGGE